MTRDKQKETKTKTGKSGGRSIHAGHRARMKERFLTSPTDSFKDHEILEMMLYYVIPQRNTNEIAHEMLSRFGSIKGIIDASPEELRTVPYLSDNAVAFFKLYPTVLRRYLVGKTHRQRFDTVKALGEYFVGRFIGEKKECVYMMFLDGGMHYIDCKLAFEGSFGSVDIPSFKFAQTAMSVGAANVVLAHNHPSGLALPSEADNFSTQHIASILEMFGIRLAEHIIVAGNRYVSIYNEHDGGEYYPNEDPEKTVK